MIDLIIITITKLHLNTVKSLSHRSILCTHYVETASVMYMERTKIGWFESGYTCSVSEWSGMSSCGLLFSVS